MKAKFNRRFIQLLRKNNLPVSEAHHFFGVCCKTFNKYLSGQLPVPVHWMNRLLIGCGLPATEKKPYKKQAWVSRRKITSRNARQVLADRDTPNPAQHPDDPYA